MVGTATMAISADRIVRVQDAAGWEGPLCDLAALLGETGAPPARVLFVDREADGAVRPVAVQAIRGVAQLAPGAFMPLPERVRRLAPLLLALVALPSGLAFVVDTDALIPRLGDDPSLDRDTPHPTSHRPGAPGLAEKEQP